MKLATLKDGTRDGVLAVVTRDLSRVTTVEHIAPTLQNALERWASVGPALRAAADALESGRERGEPFDQARCESPLPRAYQWLDGSSYLSHVERVRAARGAQLPPDAKADPLMYQGDSDYFIAPRDPITALSEDWGIDLEAEVAVILDEVPIGATPDEAIEAIRLVMLVNDISLRNVIPAELAKGFGFLNGKGQTSFSPVAVTPDELGEAWNGRTVALPLRVAINGERLGEPDAGRDMFFDFGRLISHAVKTRPLHAGTILGSGTVSNYADDVGFGCLSEIRAVETVRYGAPRTPFFRFGDRVRIEMLDRDGRSIFGAIDQGIEREPSRAGAAAGAAR